MSPRLALIAACLGLIGMAVPAPAQEKGPQVGEEVTAKTTSASWYEERDGQMVRGGPFDTLGAVIVKVAPDRLLVRWRGFQGWVKRDDVLAGPPRDAYFAERVRRDPKDAYALRYGAQAMHRTGHIDEGLAAIDESIRLNPKDPLAHQVRACLLFLGKWDMKGALEAWAAAERLDPTNEDTAMLRAGLYAAQRDYVKAMADFDRAIRLAPNDPSVYLLRAQCWHIQGDFAKAVADLDTALRLWPDLLPAHVRRVTWLLEAPDPDGRNAKEAVASARRACELTRWDDPALLRLLGRACERAGDHDQAVRWREKAEQMEQSNAAQLPPLPPAAPGR
jgi:tetratricopeptide (TPR) repeat protein